MELITSKTMTKEQEKTYKSCKKEGKEGKQRRSKRNKNKPTACIKNPKNLNQKTKTSQN
jgi:hypothetical protein